MLDALIIAGMLVVVATASAAAGYFLCLARVERRAREAAAPVASSEEWPYEPRARA